MIIAARRSDVADLNDRARRRHFFESDGASAEYRVMNADVDEVLDWARANSGYRTFVVYVEAAQERGPGLVRSLGVDPNEVT